MTSESRFNYTFEKEADYSLNKASRTDSKTGRCYQPYIASEGLVEAVQLAIDLKRPLLLEGEPGCGKTKLADAIAYQLTQNNLKGQTDEEGNHLWWPYYIWTVKSYTQARDGLYTFDAVGRLRDAQMAGFIQKQAENQIAGIRDPKSASTHPEAKHEGSETELNQVIKKLQDPKEYRKFGALGLALQETQKRAVVLIDEVDKADSDFANDLLLELDEFRFDIPETGETITPPPEPPIIILTSNREKPLPDAFLRRCLYFQIQFPSGDELKTIAERRLQDLRKTEQKLVAEVIEAFEEVRNTMNQPGSRKPGTSEFLEFLQALRRKPKREVNKALDELPNRLPLLGILLKTSADQALYIKNTASRKQQGEAE